MTNTHWCSKCHETKSLDSFYTVSGNRNKYRSICKTCSIQKSISKYHDNPETWMDSVKSWKDNNPDKVKVYTKKWQHNNSEKHRANVRAWKKRNPDKLKFYQLKSLYGISREQYESLYDSQNGRCAVCETNPSSFHLDHCHDTGFIRGLLCPSCNLGHYRDSIDLIRKKLDYLENPPAFNVIGKVIVVGKRANVSQSTETHSIQETLAA